MELAQIRYFITAAQLQNLSKAARVLNITQPALSKSIAKLEDELDVSLFERAGKSITLNESGERFLEYALNSIKELDNAVDSVKKQISSPALFLGLLIYSEKFMHCLEGFLRANPDVSFNLEHLAVSPFDIDTNKYDMLLYPQNQLFRKYKGDVIYSDPYVMAVNKSNPLAHKSVVRLRDAASHRIVFLKYDNKRFDLPYHLCVSLDIHLRDSLFTNSYEIQRCLVAGDICVSFVPQGGAGIFAADPEIRLLPVVDEGLKQDIMIGFKREKHLSAIGKQFAAFVSSYFSI